MRRARAASRFRFPAARRLAMAAACAFAFAALGGCSPIPRARTLPPTVYSIYVPMFENKTSEPGLEEIATRLTQREFLADGRLRLESRERADAWVECSIRKFEWRPVSRGRDDFPDFAELYIQSYVVVRENLARRPPIGGERKVEARLNYPSDMRAGYSKLDVDAIEELLTQLAREIVRETLTGEYGEATFATPAEPDADQDAGGPRAR